MEITQDVQPAEAPESAPKNVSSENKAVKAKNKVKEEESAAISEQKETQELDPNEKKIYQRDFLMQFRYHSQSMEKPQGLPAIGDIMIDQPYPKTSNAPPSFNEGGYRGGGNADTFSPSYMRRGDSSGHGGRDVQPAEAPESAPKNVLSENKSAKTKNNMKDLTTSTATSKHKKILKPDSNENKVYNREFLMQFRHHSQDMEKPQGLPAIGDVMIDQHYPKTSNVLPSFSEPKLKKSDYPWMSSKLDNKPPGTSKESQTVDVLPQVRSILKKLAPQRFSELMVEFRKVPINSEQSLKGVIDQIFEKTINKPELLYQCAKMCLTLSQLWSNCRVIVDIPGTSVQIQQQTAIVEFRKVLLTRCQRELEKDRQNENVISKLRQKLEEATTLETKKQCKEDLKVAEDKKRKRMLRNVRFFAELFKLKLLTESIMHTCIMSLLKDGDNEPLEFICRLLTTIGKDLDHVKEESRIDEYFREIENLTREKRTSYCVRLMIPYLVKLRKNGWRKYQSHGR